MRRSLLAAVLAFAALVAGAPASAGAATPPWRAADTVRSQVLEAQSAVILDDATGAAADLRRARSVFRGLAETARSGPAGPAAGEIDPAAASDGRRALAAAILAVRARDGVALAAAGGTVRAALFRLSYAATLAAAERGDAAGAHRWLLVREFRTATRFTRPGADATLALRRLRRGTLSPAAARAAAARDLLDAYQARLRELLIDAQRGQTKNLPARRAEAAARAEGYFAILAPRYQQDRGAAATERARADFAALKVAGVRGGPRFTTALAAATRTQNGFTASPLSAEDAARRAQQLLRFVALVPTEYGRGVSGTQVTKDFEIQEAVAFQSGATSAFADLASELGKRDPRATATARTALGRLSVLLGEASTRQDGVATHARVKDLGDTATDALKAAMPDAWQTKTDESDYDLIAITLDRMEAAAGAGQYRQAEQARLEAYAFFEFGPERRLKAFDPGLGLDVEGLVWFGADGKKGLATLIANRAPHREIRETRLALDEKLADAAATLGDSANRTTVVTNSAILVFREGLEAVLILAAITASFVGVKRRLRRHVLIGAALGLVVSIFTFILAVSVLSSLQQYGEKLEAIVGVIAIAVLLLVTNWFFHRVYWSEWIARFNRSRKRMEKLDKVGFISGQAVGLGLLGLTSVYREGFETVLFLQSLQLSAGTATVVEGAGLGLLMTLGVAVCTFVLQRKLPYKKMLIVTGGMIGFVLVVMVGQTARVMQGTGWVALTPVGGEFPYWWGVWFGVYPTWETVGAQIGAAAFVIGSFVLAREVQVNRPKRRAARQLAVERALLAEPEPADDPAMEVGSAHARPTVHR